MLLCHITITFLYLFAGSHKKVEYINIPLMKAAQGSMIQQLTFTKDINNTELRSMND